MSSLDVRPRSGGAIIFKCLTTRCVHLDLLCSLDTDSFLLALRRFTARRGTPFELWSDQGTNFKGGERKFNSINKGFNSISTLPMALILEEYGKEIRSVKQTLQSSLGAQLVTVEVLHTLLIEVKNILNSKPLGYASSDIADPDPVTPNLLMGRQDSSLPLVSYPSSDLLSRGSGVIARCWQITFGPISLSVTSPTFNAGRSGKHTRRICKLIQL
ncbi:uncharacterized protein LOC123971678 [Micropterus dolomieu]|uniref:uncharacterized protein LOC123971678 n=1 Tax=Micropterus dolomieu TaxID=147949 RepID=UPI001E8CEED7|nr:uncharacterized protein LOC123971678 [Micropterus dolomieu]